MTRMGLCVVVLGLMWGCKAGEARPDASPAAGARGYLVWTQEGGAITTSLVVDGQVVGSKPGLIVYEGEPFVVTVSEEALPPCVGDCVAQEEGCPGAGGWSAHQLAITPLLRRTGPTMVSPEGAPQHSMPNESYKDTLEIVSAAQGHIFARFTSESYMCGADGESTVERVIAVTTRGAQRSMVGDPAPEVAQRHSAAIVAKLGARYEGITFADVTLSKAGAWPVWGSGAQPVWMYGLDGECGEVCSGMVDQSMPIRVEVPASREPYHLEDAPDVVRAQWSIAGGSPMGWAAVVADDAALKTLVGVFR
jgi:hypothetical protein